MLKRCEENGDTKCYNQTLEEKEKLEEEVRTIKNDPKYLATSSGSSSGNSMNADSDEEEEELASSSASSSRVPSPPSANKTQSGMTQQTIIQQQQPQQQPQHQTLQHQQIHYGSAPSVVNQQPPPQQQQMPVRIVTVNNPSGKSKLVINQNQNRYSPYPVVPSPPTPPLNNAGQHDIHHMQSIFSYVPQNNNNQVNNGNNGGNNTMVQQQQQQQQNQISSDLNQPLESLSSLMNMDPSVNPNINNSRRIKIESQELPGHFKRRNAQDHTNLVDMLRSDAGPLVAENNQFSPFQPKPYTSHQQHFSSAPMHLSIDQHHQQHLNNNLDLSCRRLSQQMESLKFFADSDRKSDEDHVSLNLDPSSFNDELGVYSSGFPSSPSYSSSNQNTNATVPATGSAVNNSQEQWIPFNSYQAGNNQHGGNNNFYQSFKTK
jgi:hypothetical protein